jgi:putative flippase GtrA
VANRHLAIGRQFIRFAIVGTLGFVVDASVLYLCLHRTGLGLYGGRLVSYFVAATTTWYFNRKFTFTGSDDSAPTRQWMRFVVTNGFGGLINYGTYSFVVSYWGAIPMALLIGVAAGSITGLGFNFTAARLFVFKEVLPKAARPSQKPHQVRRRQSKAKPLEKFMTDNTVSAYTTKNNRRLKARKSEKL